MGTSFLSTWWPLKACCTLYLSGLSRGFLHAHQMPPSLETSNPPKFKVRQVSFGFSKKCFVGFTQCHKMHQNHPFGDDGNRHKNDDDGWYLLIHQDLPATSVLKRMPASCRVCRSPQRQKWSDLAEKSSREPRFNHEQVWLNGIWCGFWWPKIGTHGLLMGYW